MTPSRFFIGFAVLLLMASGVLYFFYTEGYRLSLDKIFSQKKEGAGDVVHLNLESVSRTPITGDDPEYSLIQDMVEKALLPSKNLPRTSSDSTVRVWVENGTLRAFWKGKTDQITINTPSTGAIRSVDFYKESTDIVLIAQGSNIYALRLGGSVKTAEAIFTGTEPSFVKNGVDTLFVLSGEELFELKL